MSGAGAPVGYKFVANVKIFDTTADPPQTPGTYVSTLGSPNMAGHQWNPGGEAIAITGQNIVATGNSGTLWMIDQTGVLTGELESIQAEDVGSGSDGLGIAIRGATLTLAMIYLNSQERVYAYTFNTTTGAPDSVHDILAGCQRAVPQFTRLWKIDLQTTPGSVILSQGLSDPDTGVVTWTAQDTRTLASLGLGTIQAIGPCGYRNNNARIVGYTGT